MKPMSEMVIPDPGSSFAARHIHPARGFNFLWHRHPEAELTLIVRGRGTRFVGDTIEPFRDGDMVLLGPGLPHTWQSTRKAPQESIFAQFSPAMMGEGFFNRPDTRHIGALLARSARGLHVTGGARTFVAEQLERLVSETGVARLVSLLSILDRLARDRTLRPLSSPAYRAAATAAATSRIDAVCAFLAANFRGRVTLTAAAARAHLSPAAFARFFHRATGRTLTGYLNELRVGHACHLLSDTDHSIAQVAFASGFHNLSHFNRRFRRSRGVTPRAYRDAFAPPVPAP